MANPYEEFQVQGDPNSALGQSVMSSGSKMLNNTGGFITKLTPQSSIPTLDNYVHEAVRTASGGTLGNASIAGAVSSISSSATSAVNSAVGGITSTVNNFGQSVGLGSGILSTPRLPSGASSFLNGSSIGGDADDMSTGANIEEQGTFGYKVRLFAVRNFPSEYVIFEVSPSLSESRTAEYASVTPVHMPGSIQVYKKTNSRSFSLTAPFISRNVEQAQQNMRYLQLLRGWLMPYFGLNSGDGGGSMANINPMVVEAAAATSYGNQSGAVRQMDNDVSNRIKAEEAKTEARTATNMNMLGAPPDVLYLYAYSSSAGAKGITRDAGNVNIKKLPVVITSMSFDYPTDVDYISTGSGDPFPVKMDVKIELLETHSPKGYEEFSLSMFKQGRLVQF